jgi:hypothetical protein
MMELPVHMDWRKERKRQPTDCLCRGESDQQTADHNQQHHKADGIGHKNRVIENLEPPPPEK